MLAVLGLVVLSAFVWVGSAVLSFLVILSESLAVDGSGSGFVSSIAVNHLSFGWMVPGLVLLVGLLGAEALGRPKALAASATVLAVQILAVIGTFIALT